MPVNMTMKEPRTSVVGYEPDGNIAPGVADVDDVSSHGVHVVRYGIGACAFDDGEGMTVQVGRCFIRYKDIDERDTVLEG